MCPGALFALSIHVSGFGSRRGFVHESGPATWDCDPDLSVLHRQTGSSSEGLFRSRRLGLSSVRGSPRPQAGGFEAEGVRVLRHVILRA